MNTQAEMLKDLIDSLLEILEEELWMLLELTNLSQDKISLLVKSDLEGLENLLSVEEEAVEKLHKKENERTKLTAQIAQILGISPGDCRLKTLLDCLEDDSAKQKLGDIRQKLKLASRKMSRSNQKAESLANQKAEYTEFLLSLLYYKSNKNTADIYNGQGKINNTDDFNRLDYTV
jgi:predicted translin family RNA/ssDNA-binding protein